MAQKKKRTSKDLLIRQPLRPLSAGQKEYLDALVASDIVLISGEAGSGKTYISTLYGAQLLYDKQVSRLVLIRPTVSCGEQIGYLPGSVQSKLEPIYLSFLDTLAEFYSANEIERLEADGAIELCPLGFIRGRTFKHSFVILDEAQNATYTQQKCFLTRIGEGAKLVMTGDITQSDLPGRKNDFATVCEKLQGCPGVEVVHLTDVDIQRHPLVVEICKRL